MRPTALADDPRPDTARAAMAEAVRADNVTQAAQILVDTRSGT
ncbi:hypothetical protein [Streptomyces sp. HD]|nr:hypothetical protein [Streptomyces sp. HD]MDC0773150.1 hypothetical protein [Streptomyces sp. HD]